MSTMYNSEPNKGWFYESAAKSHRIDVNGSVSSFRPAETGIKSFNDNFSELREVYKENCNVDIQKDISKMISNREFMEEYKAALINPVAEEFRHMSQGDPHIESIIENVNTYWDTKVKSYTESATMAQFLPIATLEFPVLVKQFFQTILKDIIEVEAVKTPQISRHICTRYLVDNQTGEEYEYPKCMFTGDWQKLFRAAKGIEIYQRVDLPVHHYNLLQALPEYAEQLAGTNPKLTFQLMIPEIVVDLGTKTTTNPGQDNEETTNDEAVVVLPGNGIRIEFSTGGTFLNGNLDFKTRIHTDKIDQAVADGTDDGMRLIQTNISGQVHYHDGLVDVSSSNTADAVTEGDNKTAKVVGVIFRGYVSNENNLRSISVREERSILRFTIEDGPRWNMPFSIEEIEDAAALLDLNYYNRMVDEIVRTQEQMETMTVIQFLNDQFRKFNGVQTDIFKLESVAFDYRVDLQPPVSFAGDPFKYISSVIQFRLKAIMHEMSDILKLENLSYIIVGNSMACQPITQFVDWKCQQGTTIGGITVNGSYGFATDMGANVRVVSTNLYQPYTEEEIEQTDKEGNVVKQQKELVLWIYGYPTTPDHISYRHLKYTSHLLTSQSQTAYTSPKISRGGAYNIVTATSRYHTLAVQGIQARLVLVNSDRIYGGQMNRQVYGAPWGPLHKILSRIPEQNQLGYVPQP